MMSTLYFPKLSSSVFKYVDNGAIIYELVLVPNVNLVPSFLQFPF